MPLQSILQELQKASQGGYAIPLFDVFDMYSVEGVFEALEGKRAPTILGFYARFFDLPNAEALTAYICTRAQKTGMPVSLMLDHGASIEQCLKALRLGFSDVMYDGSQLPFNENIQNTHAVVQAAHALGASVEAELGHVGQGDHYDLFGRQRQGFTDPALVEKFVDETGVDILAIAFGNAHGLYQGEPRLDLNLVGEIRRRVQVPLVMHGGTGLTNAGYRDVIAAGISKINIATAIVNTASARMVDEAHAKDVSMFSMMDTVRHTYRDCCSHYLDVLGTSGRG